VARDAEELGNGAAITAPVQHLPDLLVLHSL
jgi:hypothetical protein